MSLRTPTKLGDPTVDYWETGANDDDDDDG